MKNLIEAIGYLLFYGGAAPFMYFFVKYTVRKTDFKETDWVVKYRGYGPPGTFFDEHNTGLIYTLAGMLIWLVIWACICVVYTLTT